MQVLLLYKRKMFWDLMEIENRLDECSKKHKTVPRKKPIKRFDKKHKTVPLPELEDGFDDED